MADAVILIPGFFGFGQFGSPPGPTLEYFSGVRAALVRAEPSLQGRIIVHEPPPTGSLASRVATLHEVVTRVLAGAPTRHNPTVSADRVHLVGHSAGGIDARLYAHPGFTWPGAPKGDDRARNLAAIGRVVTVSSPHRGTPLAENAQPEYSETLVAVEALSVFGMGRFATVSSLIAAIAHLTPDRVRALTGDRLLAFATGLDPATAAEIQRFFNELLAHQELMRDLTPASMAALTHRLNGPEHPRIDCYVSVSPPPALGLDHPLARLLYRRLYGGTAVGVVPGPRPSGPVRAGHPIEFLREPHSNDGVVPAQSQTLDGNAAAIVEADHQDVIGHFAGGPGVTVFKSGSEFAWEGFDALWADVAARLVGA